MPKYEITATIEVSAIIDAETADHARHQFDNTPIEQIAKQFGDLEVHDVNPVMPEPKSWSRALGPLG